MIYIRYYFRLLFISSFVVAFSKCGTPKDNKAQFELSLSTPFTITDSYAQSWVAGTPEGGSGTNFFLSVKNIEKGVEIKEVHFRNKKEVLHRTDQRPELFVAYFNDNKKEDIIISSDPNAEAQNTPPFVTPFRLMHNEAIIGYKQNEKMQYFKLTEIREKPLIAYPGSKPPKQGFPEN